MMLHRTLAIALVLLSGLSGVLTMWAANNVAGFYELNPLMRLIVPSVMHPIEHTWILPVWKTSTAAVGAWFALRFSLRFPRIVTFGLAAAVTFVLWTFVLDLLELI